MNNKNIDLGCLPLFLLVFILFIIRFQIPPGTYWEKDFREVTSFLYWAGVCYMLVVIVVNKSNEPRKLTVEERLNLSIEEHKKNIERFIDTNGKFKETYKVDNSEYLSYHLVELFNAEKELSYCKSRGWTFVTYSFNKRSDHEERRKMIAKVIKDNWKHEYAFWGGLYRGQAYDIYYAIGECEVDWCHNKVSEKWHKLCRDCFLSENDRFY